MDPSYQASWNSGLGKYPESHDGGQSRRGLNIRIPPNRVGITRAALITAVVVAMLPGCSGTDQKTKDSVALSQAQRNAKGKDLAAAILGSTEDVWAAVFNAVGRAPYPAPRLVLYSGKTTSQCGIVSTTVKPWYCPADQKIYADLASLSKWSSQYGEAGDFAQAYLIANAVSKHVQNVTTSSDPSAAAAKVGDQGQDQTAQRLRYELQADCYTGVWVHFAQKSNLIEPGDLEVGVPAALAVGPADTEVAGTVIAQRMRWFRQGLASGNPRACTIAGT